MLDRVADGITIAIVVGNTTEGKRSNNKEQGTSKFGFTALYILVMHTITLGRLMYAYS